MHKDYSWKTSNRKGFGRRTVFSGINCAGVSRSQIEIYDMRVRVIGNDLFVSDRETPWYAMRRVNKFPVLSVIKNMVQEDIQQGKGDALDHVAVTPEIAAHLFGCGGFDIYGLRDSQKKEKAIRIERTALKTPTRMIPIMIVPSEELSGQAIATRNLGNEII